MWKHLVGGATLAIASAVVAGGAPVQALNTVTVTTTADVVAADGLTSLREAVDIANTDGDDTTIVLAADSTYELTICEIKFPTEPFPGFISPPPDDDANADGDLDHSAADTLRIEGNGSTIRNTCEWDRVLHGLPGAGQIELDDVTIDGGNKPPEGGTNILTIAPLVLTGVTVQPGTPLRGSAGVEVGESVPENAGLLLTMTDSTILNNGPGGVRVSVGDAIVTDSTIVDSTDGAGLTITFGSLTMTGSTIVDNNGNGISGIDADLDISNSAVGGNSGIGVRNTGNAGAGQDLTLNDVNVVQNVGGGVECSYCTGVAITNSRITLNGGTGVAMVSNVDGPSMSITTTAIVDNTATTGAGGIDLDSELGARPPVDVVRSTIGRNTAAPGVDGGGIRLIDVGLTVEHSTISDNATSGSGGGVFQTGSAPVTLDFVTLADNTAGSGAANLQTGTGPLTSTASVIAGPGTQCVDAGGAITSGGFNQIGDTSCGLTGTDDVAPAANPLLAPLAPGGGPTPTRLPLAGSPLLGAVTGPVCDTAADDQRGISRPQGLACEAGAVEENEAFLAVMITGSGASLQLDRALEEWLGDLGYVVSVVDDDAIASTGTRAATIAQLDAADLVVLSPTVVPAKVADRLNGVTSPVVNSRGELSDDLGIATTSGRWNTTTTQVDVVDPTAPLAGRVRVLRQPSRLALGRPVPAATVIATAPFRTAPAVIYWVGAGAELADGSAAAGPRGAFFLTRDGAPHVLEPAETLFDHLVAQLTAT